MLTPGSKFGAGMLAGAFVMIVTLLAASGGDASVTASGTTFSATEGISSSLLVATFKSNDSDPTAADYTATVDWGDGSHSSIGTVTATGSGRFAVQRIVTPPVPLE